LFPIEITHIDTKDETINAPKRRLMKNGNRESKTGLTGTRRKFIGTIIPTATGLLAVSGCAGEKPTEAEIARRGIAEATQVRFDALKAAADEAKVTGIADRARLICINLEDYKDGRLRLADTIIGKDLAGEGDGRAKLMRKVMKKRKARLFRILLYEYFQRAQLGHDHSVHIEHSDHEELILGTNDEVHWRANVPFVVKFAAKSGFDKANTEVSPFSDVTLKARNMTEEGYTWVAAARAGSMAEGTAKVIQRFFKFSIVVCKLRDGEPDPTQPDPAFHNPALDPDIICGEP